MNIIEIQENIEDYKSTLITFVENSEFISIEKKHITNVRSYIVQNLTDLTFVRFVRSIKHLTNVRFVRLHILRIFRS